jgi:hypothetical protein
MLREWKGVTLGMTSLSSTFPLAKLGMTIST